MRYFITLGYDGTPFHGWQIQPNGISVQEVLQKGLSTILRKQIDVVGAGRTDTGVHARTMVAHFDFDEELDCAQTAYRLNRIMPPTIAISKVERVADDMHARFSATSRTYHYYVHARRDPFLRHFSWRTPYELDFDLMNEAARILMEYEDFGAFCKSNSDTKTTICHVTAAQWHRTGEYTWYFEITANRFLRNMVRAIVGTLVEVGRKRITLEQFRQVIEQGQRTKAGESMPGHALFLEKVDY